MSSPALTGLVMGFIVQKLPSLKRTMGQPVLGVKQHRPRIAYIAGYALLVVTLVLTPIFCGVMFGDLGACFIIMFVLGGPLVIPFVNHCHAFLYPANRLGSLLAQLAVEDPVYAV